MCEFHQENSYSSVLYALRQHMGMLLVRRRMVSRGVSFQAWIRVSLSTDILWRYLVALVLRFVRNMHTSRPLEVTWSCSSFTKEQIGDIASLHVWTRHPRRARLLDCRIRLMLPVVASSDDDKYSTLDGHTSNILSN